MRALFNLEWIMADILYQATSQHFVLSRMEVNYERSYIRLRSISSVIEHRALALNSEVFPTELSEGELKRDQSCCGVYISNYM